MRHKSLGLVLLCFPTMARQTLTKPQHVIRTVNVGSSPSQTYSFADGIDIKLQLIMADPRATWSPIAANESLVETACGSLDRVCDGMVVGENHGEGFADVMVSVCKKDPSTECPREVKALVQRDETATLCIPTMRADYLYVGFRPFLERYLDYYERLGFRHIFIYGANEGPPSWLRRLKTAAADAITWIQFSFETEKLWYFGQNWEINDCIHRATSLGFTHILSLDFDELLTFTDPYESIKSYVAANHDADIFTFGSAVDRLEISCTDLSGLYCHKKPPPSKNISCHGSACGRKQREDLRLCSGFCGHRKHLVYGPRVLVANIHYVHHCKQGHRRERCVTKTESTDTAWLRHFHGERLAEHRCPSCLESD